MIDIIVVSVIVLVIAFASFYIYRAKKKGQKCIGCPCSKDCSGVCSCKETKKDN